MVIVGVLVAAALSGPMVSVSPESHDFGRIDEGQRIEFTVSVANGGDQPLRISKIETTCGCTTTRMASDSIPPGESAELTVRFNSLGRIGPQDKGVTLHTNDPRRPTVRIAVTGQVDPLVVFRPQTIAATDLGEGSRPEWTVSIEAGKPEVSFRVTGVSSNWSGISTELLVLEPGRRYALRVRTTRPLGTGFRRALLKVATDHPVYPLVNIPVTLTVPADLVLVPSSVTLGEGGSGRAVVAVRSRTRTPFRITGVVPADPRITWRVLSDGPAAHRVELGNLSLPNLVGHSVRIQTDRPAQPHLTLLLVVRDTRD